MKLTVLLVTGFASAALARNSLSVFYTFPGSGSAGEPLSLIIQASDGNFYRTASGAYPSVGVVFRITPSGQFTVVYNFPLDNATQTAPNGVVPYGQLLEARDGYLWGTTRDGGVGKQNCAGVYGCGTVFRVSKDGTSFQSVYAFCTQPTCPDGASPQGGLTQTANGTIYGNTYGTTFSTIFQVVSLNSVQTLSKFNSTTGCWIRTGLTQASDGLLYGVASACGQSGGGTVFQATPAGVVNVLHNFGIATPAGSGPSGQLIQGISGKLYGTTLSGGTSGGCGGNGCGTVFEIDTTGGFQTLYNFDSNTTGNGPLGGLLQSSGGNLWGTTISGPKTGFWGCLRTHFNGFSCPGPPAGLLQYRRCPLREPPLGFRRKSVSNGELRRGQRDRSGHHLRCKYRCATPPGHTRFFAGHGSGRRARIDSRRPLHRRNGRHLQRRGGDFHCAQRE